MKKKRITVAILTIMLAASTILSGCSGNGTDTQKKTETSVEQTDQKDTDQKEKEEKEELIRHIYELAVHTWGERLTVEDQMIALSTCSSGNTNGRHLLICKVIKENTVEGSETE